MNFPGRDCIYLGKSKNYKGVYLYKNTRTNKIIYKYCNFTFLFDKERDAAIFYDYLLIKRGKQPVNILKKK